MAHRLCQKFDKMITGGLSSFKTFNHRLLLSTNEYTKIGNWDIINKDW